MRISLVSVGLALGLALGHGAIPPVAATARATAIGQGVGVRTTTLVDPTRPTPATPGVGVDGAADRTLSVTVWYPARVATTSTAATPVVDARPAPGRHPLILYAPGNGARGADAPALVRAWAALGYVVVAPDFPVSGRARGNLDAVDDWSAQPGDVRFVLDRALSADGIAGLGAVVDRGRVGLAGHSLGAMTVLGVAFGTDPDPRVDAVTSFAGFPALAGADVSTRTLPLLLVHGDDDPVIPADRSRAMSDGAAGPHALVLVAGGGHSSYLRAPDPETATVLATATGTFWDATLARRPVTRGDPDDRLGALGVPGRFTVTTGPAPNLRIPAATR